MSDRIPIEAFDPDGGVPGQMPRISLDGTVLEWGDPIGGALPAGGVTGQVLTKLSSTDGDADWQTPTAGSTSGSSDWRYEPYSNRVSPLNTAREDRQVGTWDYVNNTTAITSGFLYNASGAQNDAIAFYIWLSAGTYRLDVVGSTQNNRAISTWELDDGAGTYTLLGTMDWYAAGSSATYNVVKSITGIPVTGGLARRRLRCKVASRNASASGWFVAPQVISFLRTA